MLLEQGRVYRATINGLISTSDGVRLMVQLREIRCSLEAVAAEAAAIAAAVPPNYSMTVAITTVPSGMGFTETGRAKLVARVTRTEGTVFSA